MSTKLRRASVWLARITTGLIAGAAGAVVLEAASSILALRSSPVDAERVAPMFDGHGRGRGAPARRPADPSEPPIEADDEEAPEVSGQLGQLGQTRQAVVLRERPLASSTVMGRVDEGELVSILQINGDWALVYYGGRDSLVAGWAKKSEIAIR